MAAIQATLPNSLEPFATYDLRDLKQRRWLTRYCIKKEAGELDFKWSGGHPVAK